MKKNILKIELSKLNNLPKLLQLKPSNVKKRKELKERIKNERI